MSRQDIIPRWVVLTRAFTPAVSPPLTLTKGTPGRMVAASDGVAVVEFGGAGTWCVSFDSLSIKDIGESP